MIKTTVARIFSTRHVALAAGSDQGVKEGMVFVIYTLSDQIIDPMTGLSLGQLEIVKGKVRVFYIQEKMCQAETFSHTVTEVVDPLKQVSGFLTPLKPHEEIRIVHEELQVDHAAPILADLTVRVGDLARTTD